ncbi:helix-turn-helix domain-containing protein [Lachnospiraceae bacterium C1.1]|nr:helix-turn-helix transcriptional regulator [Lachnospiraceae bacterium C1.1]
MNIGERIKKIRKERGMSAEDVAEKLGVSISTLYRYENSSISKIPVTVIDKLCEILGTTAKSLMGNDVSPSTEDLPDAFANAAEAMAFILKMPVLAAYGGYDINSMDEDTIIQFANEILEQLKLVSYKYQLRREKGEF